MQTKNLLLVIVVSTLLACNNEKKAAVDPIPKNIDYSSLGQSKSQKVMLSNPSNGNVVLNPKHGEPGHRCDIAVGAPLNSAAPKPTTITPPTAPAQNNAQTVTKITPPAPTAKGINPPHGQPNHRCDIAVGAPLNSKPISATVSTSANTSVKPPVITAKGMNPPHGQPNHRCDIAVGAPLDSKPTNTPASTPTTTPVTNTSGNN